MRILLLFTSLIFLSAFFEKKEEIAPEPFTAIEEKSDFEANNFMVVAGHPLASEAGAYILSKGGNAVDAAIAVQMVLNLVEPHASGIGGGGFFIYYDKAKNKSFFYDGRETAPKKIKDDVFLDKEGKPRNFFDVEKGGLSVGVPGLLKMLKKVHDDKGQLPWFELFVPAIDLAAKGYDVSPRLATLTDTIPHIQEFATTKNYFFNNFEESKEVKNVIYNQEFADVLREIAANGIDSFYRGEIAEDIVDAVQNSEVNPGSLTVSDLKNYKVKIKDLICVNYRKYKVCSIGMPSSGGVTVLQTLAILENFDLGQLDYQSAEAVHLVSEALRLAYADRNFYAADDEFVNVPVNKMLDKEYLKRRSFLINVDSAMRDVKPGDFSKDHASFMNSFEPPSTTHISIVDKYGNAVSFTSSIEYSFGSGVMVRGFLLNNQLTDFAFVPEVDGKKVSNRIEPGKKPRSSMSPTLVFDENDELLLVVGSPGGSRIISYVTKTILAVLDWGIDVNNAVALPNYTKMNDVLELEEDTYLVEMADELAKKGHKVKVRDMISGIHAIYVGDRLEAGIDTRREGSAAGQ